MGNVNLTDADKLALSNLTTIWNRERDIRRFTQESAAAEIALKNNDKTNQAALGHYLNGRRRLTAKAVLMFSSFLKVSPKEIRDDLDYGFLSGSPATLTHESPKLTIATLLTQMNAEYENADTDIKEAIDGLYQCYQEDNLEGIRIARAIKALLAK